MDAKRFFREAELEMQKRRAAEIASGGGSGVLHDRLPHEHGRSAPEKKPRPLKYLPTTSDSTSPLVWITASICAVMWSIIILVGIAVLVVYLVYRPHSPRVEISAATLSAAYIDSDPIFGTANLLNADLSLLLNFSNPNEKVSIVLTYVSIDLYFGDSFLATQGVVPFEKGMGATGGLRRVELLASEVSLSIATAKEWKQQLTAGGVVLEVRGRLRTRSELGGWLKFKYWLHTRCSLAVSAPPAGVMVASQCKTKR